MSLFRFVDPDEGTISVGGTQFGLFSRIILKTRLTL